MDQRGSARSIVLAQLAASDRTWAQLRQTLQARGIGVEIAEQVITEFAEQGLVDDANFAAEWVRSRHEHRGLSRQVLTRELAQRGVAAETVAQAVAAVSAESEFAAATELARKRLRGQGPPVPPAQVRRVVAFLARRGHSQSVAVRALRAALEPEDSAAHEYAESLELPVDPED